MTTVTKASVAALLLATIVTVGSFGCGARQADVILMIAPDPVAITGFNFGHGRIYDQATWMVRVTEMAGIDGQLESLTSVVRDVATGEVVGEVSSSGYSSRVEGHSSVTIQQSWQVARDIGNAFRPRRFETTLVFRDEKGNRIEQQMTAAGEYQ